MKSIATKKPWGMFVSFTHNEQSTVKLLYVSKGEKISLQYHSHREEFWRIIKGSPEITIDDEVFNSKEDEEFTIPPFAQHRISAPVDDVIVLEISKGEFDENDIVRIEDKYDRV